MSVEHQYYVFWIEWRCSMCSFFCARRSKMQTHSLHWNGHFVVNSFIFCFLHFRTSSPPSGFDDFGGSSSSDDISIITFLIPLTDFPFLGCWMKRSGEDEDVSIDCSSCIALKWISNVLALMNSPSHLSHPRYVQPFVSTTTEPNLMRTRWLPIL